MPDALISFSSVPFNVVYGLGECLFLARTVEVFFFKISESSSAFQFGFVKALHVVLIYQCFPVCRASTCSKSNNGSHFVLAFFSNNRWPVISLLLILAGTVFSLEFRK